MKNRLKLAKEMVKEKLAEANAEEVKSNKKAQPNNAKIHVKKPPRYAGVISIGIALVAFYLGFNETKLIWESRNMHPLCFTRVVGTVWKI